LQAIRARSRRAGFWLLAAYVAVIGLVAFGHNCGEPVQWLGCPDVHHTAALEHGPTASAPDHACLACEISRDTPFALELQPAEQPPCPPRLEVRPALRSLPRRGCDQAVPARGPPQA
jgi:hypothetical protein